MRLGRWNLTAAAVWIALPNIAGAQQWPSSNPAQTSKWPSSYMRADRAPAERMFGSATTANIFSSSMDQARREFVENSLRNRPVPGCPPSPPFTITHVIPLQYNAENAVWKERIDIACQPSVRRSMLAVAASKGGTKVGELFPGDTIADTQLQRDLVVGLVQVSTLKRPDCKQSPKVMNTKLLVAPTSQSKAWSELWSLDICGTAADVEISFQPAPDGGTNWTTTMR